MNTSVPPATKKAKVVVKMEVEFEAPANLGFTGMAGLEANAKKALTQAATMLHPSGPATSKGTIQIGKHKADL